MNIPFLTFGRLAAAVAVLAAVLAAAPARAQLAYLSNFSSGAGAVWSRTDTTTAPSGTQFLGPFQNDTVRLSLTDLPAHTYVTLTFDVYALRGWNGNDTDNGPDTFTVDVPDAFTLVQTGFSNTTNNQGYPEGAPYSSYPARRNALRSNTLGYANPGDTTYRITRSFAHSGPDLKLDFAASGLTGTAAWGLDTVRVTVSRKDPGSVVSNGDFELPAVSTLASFTTGGTFSGWTVASGVVAVRRGWQPGSGEQILDLSLGQPGTVYQDIPVAPGQQYNLRFRLAANPGLQPPAKSVQVQWGNSAYFLVSADSTGHTPQDLGWTDYSYLVAAPSDANSIRLTFQMASAGPGGALLDAVSVTPVIPGDVNNDGVVDMVDAVLASRIASGLTAADAAIRDRADVHPFAGTGSRRHGDGTVNGDDVAAIARIAADGVSHRDLAEAGVSDLFQHFWVGSPTSGHVLPTWGGKYNTSFPNGSMWEHAQMLRTMMDLYRVNGDSGLLNRIRSDWNWTVNTLGVGNLTRVGAGTNMNWSDDAGWAMLMYLDVYRATGQQNALTYAKTLFNNTYNRWADNTYGGGLWYTDEHKQKAVYQVSQILAGLRIYDLTGEASYKDRALSLYNWVHTHLERGSGLYYVDYNANGPAKNNNPPRQASSDTMLAGNMAMAVVAARLYRATGDDAYRLRAIHTANAILAVENDGGGILLNDRDANVEGYYAVDWAAEVLTLPGIGPEHAAALRRTAASIYTAARTQDGYYSGNWSGPAQGPLMVWGKGGGAFSPDEIVVSSNGVHMMVGAAAIGVVAPETARPIAPPAP